MICRSIVSFAGREIEERAVKGYTEKAVKVLEFWPQ